MLSAGCHTLNQGEVLLHVAYQWMVVKGMKIMYVFTVEMYMLSEGNIRQVKWDNVTVYFILWQF